MAKKMYIGVGGTAKKVKKMYAGSGGLARKVRRGYIGVGGVARPFFSGGDLTYIGAYTDAYASRWLLSAAAVGDYVLFAGGHKDGSATASVSSINRDFVKAIRTELYGAAVQLMGASVGDYAVFAGGNQRYTGTPNPNSRVTAYDTALVRSQSSLSAARGRGVGLSTGAYAIIGCGNSNTTSAVSAVDAFNASLVRTDLSSSAVNASCGGAMAGNNAVFAGGGGTTAYSAVESYDMDLVRTRPTSLSKARTMLAGASIGGKYAAFFGGTTRYDTSSAVRQDYKTVDIYDDSLVRVYSGEAPVTGVRAPTGGSLGGFGIFVGGYYAQSYETDEGNDTEIVRPLQAFAYDENLLYMPLNGIQTDFSASATLGDYCFFGTYNKNIHVYGLI